MPNMLRFIAVVLLASTACATTFSNCDDLVVNGPPIVSLDVLGCTEEPCLFIRGENVNARVKFQTKGPTPTLRSTIRAETLGLITTFPLPNPDGCQSLSGAECPLVAEETATYVLEMPVLQEYPKVNLRVEHTLTAADGIVSCFWMRAKVVDPEDVIPQ